MESDRYRKFLEQQAKRNPVNIEESMDRRRFRISWERSDENPVRESSSDLLDSLYLGKDMKETVTIDRRVAGMLQERLRGLEEENNHLRKRMKSTKIILGAIAVVATILLVAFLASYSFLPPLAI